VFGSLRDGHTYSAPCRTYAGGPFDNRIIWYYVPDDAPLYEGLSAFEPRVDEMFEKVNDTFEKAGFGLKPRKHTRGIDIWFRDALGVIGDEDDFAGRATADKCQCQEGPPHEPCVSGPHAFNEIAFDNRSRSPRAGEFQGKLMLGGVFTRPADLLARGGLALGDVWTYTPPEPIELVGGLALAGVLVQTPATAIHADEGLALGGIVTYLPESPFYLWRGFALAGVLVQTPATAIHADEGLALGGVLVQTPATAIHANEGLKLGGILVDASTTEETVLDGLALGDVWTVPTEAGPGDDCASAGVLSLGVTAAGHFTSFATHWWRQIAAVTRSNGFWKTRATIKT
jgi:hypothetical protein